MTQLLWLQEQCKEFVISLPWPLI